MPKIDPAEFVAIWNRAASVQEVVLETGLKRKSAISLAARLRKRREIYVKRFGKSANYYLPTPAEIEKGKRLLRKAHLRSKRNEG